MPRQPVNFFSSKCSEDDGGLVTSMLHEREGLLEGDCPSVVEFLLAVMAVGDVVRAALDAAPLYRDPRCDCDPMLRGTGGRHKH